MAMNSQESGECFIALSLSFKHLIEAKKPAHKDKEILERLQLIQELMNDVLADLFIYLPIIPKGNPDDPISS